MDAEDRINELERIASQYPDLSQFRDMTLEDQLILIESSKETNDMAIEDIAKHLHQACSGDIPQLLKVLTVLTEDKAELKKHRGSRWADLAYLGACMLTDKICHPVLKKHGRIS